MICDHCGLRPANEDRDEACDTCDVCYADLNDRERLMANMQALRGAVEGRVVGEGGAMYGFLWFVMPHIPEKRRREIARSFGRF